MYAEVEGAWPVLAAIFGALIGMALLYFVIRLAVRHALEDSRKGAQDER